MMKIKHLQQKTIEFLANDYLELARLKKQKNNEVFDEQKALNFFNDTIVKKDVGSLCEMFPYLYRELGIESRLREFENVVLNDANLINYQVEEFEEERKAFKWLNQ